MCFLLHNIKKINIYIYVSFVTDILIVLPLTFLVEDEQLAVQLMVGWVLWMVFFAIWFATPPKDEDDKKKKPAKPKSLR